MDRWCVLMVTGGGRCKVYGRYMSAEEAARGAADVQMDGYTVFMCYLPDSVKECSMNDLRPSGEYKLIGGDCYDRIGIVGIRTKAVTRGTK